MNEYSFDDGYDDEVEVVEELDEIPAVVNQSNQLAMSCPST